MDETKVCAAPFLKMSDSIVKIPGMTALDSYQKSRDNLQILIQLKQQELYDLIVKKIQEAEQNGKYRTELLESDLKKDKLLERGPKFVTRFSFRCCFAYIYRIWLQI